MDSEDKNNKKNNETDEARNENTAASEFSESPRYAAYKLFGDMRSNTEEENKLFSDMMQRLGTPVGINLFDLSEEDIATLKSGKPVAIGKFVNAAELFEDDATDQNVGSTTLSVNGIPLRQKTKYIFSDNGNICQIVSPDFTQMRAQRDAAMSEEEKNELAQRQENGESALIIPFEVIANMHANRHFVMLPPDVLQSEIERVQREILEMELAQAVMRELGTGEPGEDMSPELIELLDELDNECDYNDADDCDGVDDNEDNYNDEDNED